MIDLPKSSIYFAQHYLDVSNIIELINHNSEMSESFIDLSDNNYVITCSNCLLPKVISENVNLKAHLIFEVLYCYYRTEVLIIQPLWLLLMSLYSKGLKKTLLAFKNIYRLQ